MAICFRQLCRTNLNKNLTNYLIIPIRNGYRLRGKPPTEARNIKQRLEELNWKDPTITYRIDISLPQVINSKSKQFEERLKVAKEQKTNRNLEKLARELKLEVNLEDCYNEWRNENGPKQFKKIADHYGIYEHLFGDAYFLPIVPLSIYFNCGDVQHPVYFGNVIKPTDAIDKPDVIYESNNDTLWTLILTNPDGHFTKQNSEYVHWFVGNIPGNQVGKGETVVEYLQPFPPKGTGYHRHIFILYKQEKKIDYSAYKRDGKCLNLDERTFSTLDFYKQRQDDLTPGGLAFFQADWDRSLSDFYHNVLNIKEPIFEYDFPPPYIRKQEWYPLRQPFNLYMDKYRDPKQINKEFLMRKLKKVHPFKPPSPPLPYPAAQPWTEYTPSWLQLEKTKSRLKWGRINDIE